MLTGLVEDGDRREGDPVSKSVALGVGSSAAVPQGVVSVEVSQDKGGDIKRKEGGRERRGPRFGGSGPDRRGVEVEEVEESIPGEMEFDQGVVAVGVTLFKRLDGELGEGEAAANKSENPAPGVEGVSITRGDAVPPDTSVPREGESVAGSKAGFLKEDKVKGVRAGKVSQLGFTGASPIEVPLQDF